MKGTVASGLILITCFLYSAYAYSHHDEHLPPEIRQHASINWYIDFAANLAIGDAIHLDKNGNNLLAYRPELTYLSPDQTISNSVPPRSLEEYSTNRFSNAHLATHFTRTGDKKINLNNEYRPLVNWHPTGSEFINCDNTSPICSAYYNLHHACKSTSTPVHCSNQINVSKSSGELRYRPELGGAYTRDERVNFSNWYQYYAFNGARIKTLLLLLYKFKSTQDNFYIKHGNRYFLINEELDLSRFIDLKLGFNTSTIEVLNTKQQSSWPCNRFIHLDIRNKPKSAITPPSITGLNGFNILSKSEYKLQPWLREFGTLEQQLTSVKNNFTSSDHIQYVSLSLDAGDHLDQYSWIGSDLLSYQTSLTNIPYYQADLNRLESSYRLGSGQELNISSYYDGRLNQTLLSVGVSCESNCQNVPIRTPSLPSTYSAYPVSSGSSHLDNWKNIDLSRADELLTNTWISKNKLEFTSEEIKELLLRSTSWLERQVEFIATEYGLFAVHIDANGFLSLYKSNASRISSTHASKEEIVQLDYEEDPKFQLIWRFLAPSSSELAIKRQALNTALLPAVKGAINHQEIELNNVKKHILVFSSGLNNGAYTALDITANIQGRDIGPKMLWQFGLADNTNLGSGLLKPIFIQADSMISARNTEQAAQWLLAIANGYKSRNVEICDQIYFLNPLTGALQASVRAGPCIGFSGVGKIVAIDLNQDGLHDYLYAASLDGKVRRIRLEGNARQWQFDKFSGRDYLFQAIYQGKPQAIVSSFAVKELFYDGRKRVLLAISTGKALIDKHEFVIAPAANTLTTQSLYLIEDKSACLDACQSHSSFVSNLYELEDLSGLGDRSNFSFQSYQGWYFHFGVNEQALYAPIFIDRFLFIQAYTLQSHACRYTPLASKIYAFSLSLKNSQILHPNIDGNFEREDGVQKVNILSSKRQPLRLLKCSKYLCLSSGYEMIGIDDGFKNHRRRWQVY